MAKKKSHTGFRNEKLFCFNCGASYNLHLPQPITIMSAIMKQFNKDHKNCPATWVEPVNESPELKTEDENVRWWIENGEHGISSKTMLEHLFFKVQSELITSRAFLYPDIKVAQRHQQEGHPCDPDDFRRCYLLLKYVPQLNQKLHLMKDVSKPWRNLVDNWHELSELLEEQMRTNKANGMYELMQTLIK